MPHYSRSINVVPERFLTEKYTSIKHVSACAVKREYVLLLMILKEHRSKGTPGTNATFGKVLSTSSAQCITTSMCPNYSTAIFLPSPMMKKISSGLGNRLF